MSYTLMQNINIALKSMGIDSLFIIKETFLGYKYRKLNHILYNQDQDIPTKLITLYYGLNDDRVPFNTLKKMFVSHYINQESKLEGIDVKSKHSRAEVEGLGKMYEYIHSDDINYMFDVYTLKEIHKQLYSLTDYPEYGGTFRNSQVYIKNRNLEICDWWNIREELEKVDVEIQKLRKEAEEIKKFESTERLLEYLDKCIKIQNKLLVIHPFSDGNGRTIRGFTNKLLEDAGLPPIYIKASEKDEYLSALAKSDNGDFQAINNFYRYKICDSIVELDINQRIYEDKEEAKQKALGTL